MQPHTHPEIHKALGSIFTFVVSSVVVEYFPALNVLPNLRILKYTVTIFEHVIFHVLVKHIINSDSNLVTYYSLNASFITHHTWLAYLSASSCLLERITFTDNTLS